MSNDEYGINIAALFGDKPTPAPAPDPAPASDPAPVPDPSPATDPAPAAPTSSNRKDRSRGGNKPPPVDNTYEAVETVEEVETTVPMTPEQQLAAAEKARDEALAAIAKERRIREEAAKTPEGRRRDRAEKAIQERLTDSLDIQIGSDRDNPIFSTRQQARQSRGGFMQEAQIPVAPTDRKTGEPITIADSIKRLSDRIQERKDEKMDLEKSPGFIDPDSRRAQQIKQMRLEGRTRPTDSKLEQRQRDMTQRYAQIDREIKAMRQLKSELEAKQAADSSE